MKKEKYPIDLEFYSHYLMAIREKIVVALRNGTSKLTIKPDELNEYPIEYFSMDEQLEKKKEILERQNKLQNMEERIKQAKAEIYKNISMM